MRQNADLDGGKGGRLRKFLYSEAALRLLICVLGTALLVALFEVAIVPQRYDLKVGDEAPGTITATKDVVDERSTREKREYAARITASYRELEGVSDSVMISFEQVFSELFDVCDYGETLGKSVNKRYTKSELQDAHAMLTLIDLNDDQVTNLLRVSRKNLEQAYEQLYPVLENAMKSPVYEGQEASVVNTIRQNVSYNVNDAYLRTNIVPAVLSAVIRPNLVINQEATEAARQAAWDAVEPVVYKQGDVIVKRGEAITENQLAVLSSLGLLSGGSVDMTIYLGAALLVVMVTAVMLLLLRELGSNSILDPVTQLLLMFLVMALSMLLSLLAHLVNPYLAPTLLCALLMTGLLGIRPGVICGAALTILVAALAAGGSEEYAEKMTLLIISGLLSGTAASMLLSRKGGRVWVLLAGLLGCCVDFLSMLGLGLMTDSELTGAMTNALWRMGGSLLSTLLCIALQPLIEMLFNLPTPMKLMELSNPNQPLLKRLLLEAPGTYHHATIVANLAEAAAEAVGANPLLARVGGYYHDIGKLKRPSFFAENQLGGANAHDHTDPYVSAAIVTSHTRDGVAIAKEYRLPQAIQTIIAEHHGNTPTMYFYHKALQQADGKPVDINAFRYDGAPPKTREGAIVMICDTIEAAVRTMKNPTTEGIEEYVVKLVRNKLEDGQLSDSPLTLRDIDRICAAATQVLVGVFHERIEYPDMDETMARAQQTDLAVEEAEIQASDAVTIPGPRAEGMVTVEFAAPKPMTVISPEASEGLVEVEPGAAAKPVPIDELVTIEPLPTKEMEKELLEKQKADNAPGADAQPRKGGEQPEDDP